MIINKIDKVVLDNPIDVYDITVSNKLGAQNFLTGSKIILKNCGPVCHSSVTASASSTVFINSIPANRVGDSVECGGTVSTGSPNVNIGG